MGTPAGTPLQLEIIHSRAPVKPPREQTLRSPQPKVTSVLTRMIVIMITIIAIIICMVISICIIISMISISIYVYIYTNIYIYIYMYVIILYNVCCRIASVGALAGKPTGRKEQGQETDWVFIIQYTTLLSYYIITISIHYIIYYIIIQYTVCCCCFCCRAGDSEVHKFIPNPGALNSCMHTFIYIYIYICTCIYIYIYTHELGGFLGSRAR